METVLLLIAVLACPVGMLAMGGIAWVSAKTFGKRSNHRPADAADQVGR